jgi:hypothetical protein
MGFFGWFSEPIPVPAAFTMMAVMPKKSHAWFEATLPAIRDF